MVLQIASVSSTNEDEASVAKSMRSVKFVGASGCPSAAARGGENG